MKSNVLGKLHELKYNLKMTLMLSRDEIENKLKITKDDTIKFLGYFGDQRFFRIRGATKTAMSAIIIENM